MVAKGRKITNVPQILKVCDFIFGMAKQIINHFLGFYEVASTFLTPKLPIAALRTALGSKRSRPLRKTLRNRRLCVLPA
jgi:hypothetical protein